MCYEVDVRVVQFTLHWGFRFPGFGSRDPHEKRNSAAQGQECLLSAWVGITRSGCRPVPGHGSTLTGDPQR